jgi:F-type H+-transporting ATPase subunit a
MAAPDGIPHDDSWLSFLPGYDAFAHWAEEGLKVEAYHEFMMENVPWAYDGHITVQHIVGSLFVLLLLFIMGLVVSRETEDVNEALVPEDKLSIRTFVELVVTTTYDTMADMMGRKAAKFFLPLIGTCAFFIFFSNALGLVPGFIPPTDNLNVTLACGAVIFFTTHIFGVKEHGLPYFKHFFGPIQVTKDTPLYAVPFVVALMLLMLLIETISHIVRPLSLAIRLAANMTADHKVLLLFTGFGVASVVGLFPAAMYMMGTLVVTVQTLVFCLLSVVYISMAIAHEEH